MGETEFPAVVLGQLGVAVCVDAYTIRGEGLRGANSPPHAPSFECVICHVGPPQGLCSPINTIDCRSISTISPVLIHSPVIRCDVHSRMTPRYALDLTGSLTEREDPVRICRGICAALMQLIRTEKRFGSPSLSCTAQPRMPNFFKNASFDGSRPRKSCRRSAASLDPLGSRTVLR